MKNDVEQATLIPSSGGVFTVRVDGNPVYSKQETGRFPNPGEVLNLVKARV